MRIYFYPPFKPLGHPHPSGDLIIGTGIHDYLINSGHDVLSANSLRSRWIYWKPWMLPKILLERRRSILRIKKFQPDLWLTYHTYYKAPDVLGPYACRKSGIPYVIFQGIYSTKRRRNPYTYPGYRLNKKALCAADHVFTNRKEDRLNLKRLLPENQLTYIAPGIYPEQFPFDPESRSELRKDLSIENELVVITAAMFRPGIKVRGIRWTIRACGTLLERGLPIFLLIIGDGKGRSELEYLAEKSLNGRFQFIGKVPRENMYKYYSGGDLFAFPGFRESLGMVYLEAQSCGLPVVACRNGGIPEVVMAGETGLLVPMDSFNEFVDAMGSLIENENLRTQMGKNAVLRVRQKHNLNLNYKVMEEKLMDILKKRSLQGHYATNF